MKESRRYEVQKKTYRFDKYTRVCLNDLPIQWRHTRYYDSLQQATDAIFDLRRSYLDKAYYDYPGTEYETKYPHLKPMINITRYRINQL